MPRDPTVPEEARPRFLLLALVLLVPVAVFWPILSNGFVYDDHVIVERNPLITGFGNIPAMFTSAVWDILEPAERSRVGYWRPLTNVAMTAANVWGGGSALAFHALSLLLHLAATAAAFALAWRITKRSPIAAGAALLFAVHPMQVESVAWLSSMNSLLFGAFALLALERFRAWRERGSIGLPWSAGALFLAALLSKELAIAVVPVALALDQALGRGPARDAAAPQGTEGIGGTGGAGAADPLHAFARAYAPFAVAFGLYWLARANVFGSPFAGFDLVTTDFQVDARRMALLRVELLGGFLALLAWPWEQNLFRPFVPGLGAFEGAMVAAWIALLAGGAIAWFAWRRGATVVVAGLLFAVAAVLPALVSVGSIGIFPLSERFLYLAVFGLALAIAWAAHRFLPGWIAGAAVLVLAGVLGARSLARTHVWSTDGTLFAAAVAASPDSPYVQWCHGRVLLEKYRARAADPTPSALEDLARAHQAFENALELANRAQHGDGRIFAVVSDFVQANVGLASCLLYEAEIEGYNDFETPLRVLENVVERYPAEESGHVALGVTLQRLGRFDEAEKAFLEAAKLNPLFAEAWRGLGLVRMRRGNAKTAAEAFERALALRPYHLDDLVWLARAEAENDRPERALELLELARERHPRAAAPLVWRATVLAQENRHEEALELVRRALELDPDDGDAQMLKGRLHARADERTSAEAAFVRAADLMPQSFEAHYNAASVLLQDRELGIVRAMPYLVRAYELRPPGKVGATLQETLRRIPLGNADVLWDLASADATRADDASAMDWVDRALTAKPDHGPSHFLKAHLSKKKGDLDGAIANWTLAAAEMPGSIPARLSLGNTLAEKGRLAEALKWLEEALALAQKAQGSSAEARGALELLRQRVTDVRARLGQH